MMHGDSRGEQEQEVYGRQLKAGRNEPILEPDLPIIDSHHHLFDRPARPGQPPLRYLLDDYLADASAGHNIVASVYMEILAFARQDGPEVLRPLGEVEFANGIAATAASGRYGPCRVAAGIVGYADLRLGDAVGGLLDRCLQAAPERFRGVRQVTIAHFTEAPYRFITNRPPKDVMTSPGFRPAFEHLIKRNLSFDAAVFHHQLQEVIDLADAYPEATVILNHCGHAILMDETDDAGRQRVFEHWRTLMGELARRPNVYCKVGGMGLIPWAFGLEERSEPVGYLELARLWEPWVMESIEAFGAERCMMESNYPPDGRSAGFVPLWNALKHIVRGATADDKAALFHGTAARAYRLSVPGLK
ncbi:MAG: amidohydrolase [Rhodoferax sp.]|nr:amidohydrolase [Rhodoferax sp.]